MDRVKCIKCDWIGNEDDLEECPDENGQYGDGAGCKGCPECKTDDYLMDIDPLPTISSWQVLMKTEDGKTIDLEDVPDEACRLIDEQIALMGYPCDWQAESKA